jgi:NADPH-dependent curcumin reductase CurA
MAEYGEHFDLQNPIEAKDTEYQGTDDFRLRTLKITSPNGGYFDIKSIFVSMNIYQDLFSNCMSADITLIDSGNIKKFLPIVGQEETVTRNSSYGFHLPSNETEGQTIRY